MRQVPVTSAQTAHVRVSKDNHRVLPLTLAHPGGYCLIEDSNTAFFKKSTQSLIWHARLYAKKFGDVLPELALNNITRATGTSSNPVQKIPGFLLKSISNTEPTKTNDGRN
jgi:hypothetical protein